MTIQTARSPSDRCPKCGRRPKRSSEQSRRYWKLVYRVADEYLPDGQRFSARVWHEQFKAYWLGCDEMALPDGRTMVIPKSTADLSVDEFSDFMTAVESWAASRNVFLED